MEELVTNEDEGLFVEEVVVSTLELLETTDDEELLLVDVA